MGSNHREFDEETLLRAVSEGDAGAMPELYERHAPWLSARLMRRCNDREVIMDVVQGTTAGRARHRCARPATLESGCPRSLTGTGSIAGDILPLPWRLRRQG